MYMPALQISREAHSIIHLLDAPNHIAWIYCSFNEKSKAEIRFPLSSLSPVCRHVRLVDEGSCPASLVSRTEIWLQIGLLILELNPVPAKKCWIELIVKVRRPYFCPFGALQLGFATLRVACLCLLWLRLLWLRLLWLRLLLFDRLSLSILSQTRCAV